MFLAGEMDKQYYCYIVRCADDSLYTGISTDVERRVKQHNAGRGAKYTSQRLPVELIYTEPVGNRAEALVRERAIKKLPRSKKFSLASSKP